MAPRIVKSFFDEKASSRRRLCAIKSFVHGRGRQAIRLPSHLARGAFLETSETSDLTRSLVVSGLCGVSLCFLSLFLCDII
jgi:hypothetical protein